jgi:hypothetical protein
MRKVIFAGVLIGSALLGQKSKVTVDVDASFARHNVTVTPHTAANFRSVVESFAGKAGAEALAPIHPLLVSIRNDSGLAITSVIFQYPRVNASGEAIHTDRTIQTVGALAFPPGATLLLSPDGRLNYALNGRLANASPTPARLQRTLTAGRDELLANEFDPARFPHVTVSLDSVTLSDGSVIGPDRTDIVGRELRKGLAEKLLLEQVSDARLSDDDVSKWLDEDRKRWEKAPILDPATGMTDMAGVYRWALEGSLLKGMPEHGRASAIEFLEGVVNKRAGAPQLVHVKD